VSRSARRARILLIEDDAGDQELTRRALQRDGILADLEVLEDGKEALERLQGEGRAGAAGALARPDLILLDLNLPGTPGKEVLARIKQDPELRRIPVVVVSTSARDADVARCYELGCNSYLIKPLEADRYRAALQEIYAYWFQVVSTPPA
jgi:two-component system response regulator